MELGIFSKGYKKYVLSEAFTRIRQVGLSAVQFNFANVGLASLQKQSRRKRSSKLKRQLRNRYLTCSHFRNI